MEFGIPRDENHRQRHREPLRAEGNLTYPEFINLVRNLWKEVNPSIPIKPTQSKTYSQFPCIVYGLEMRSTHNVEPKPRYREEIYTDGDVNYIVHGQRFDNMIKFTVLTQNDPELAEAIIENFEDFMLQYTPIFKRLGVSDIFYNRRMADSEQTRTNEDVEERSVVYFVILEKLSQISENKIKEVVINARTLSSGVFEGATPDSIGATPSYVNIEDTFSGD